VAVARNNFGVGIGLSSSVVQPAIAFNPNGLEHVVRIPSSEFAG
jgi:hypothetical protein